jgi:hypothetical protein
MLTLHSTGLPSDRVYVFAHAAYTNPGGDMMKIPVIALILISLLTSIPVMAFEGRAYKLREDMGTEPLSGGALNYYYYVPCPTYSWFWAFGGLDDPWEGGTAVGAWFEIGDISTGGWGVCDPTQCHTLDRVRVLDMEGLQGYPGYFRCIMDVYCCDEYGCPVGPSLWNTECWTGYAWNYFDIDPPLCISGCSADPGPPASRPRILVTLTHAAHLYGDPLAVNLNAWGTDLISRHVEDGCIMHDYGCLPALYPRPYISHYDAMHSGYYGQDFEYCPPQWFKDPQDFTPDGSEYGFVELAWRIYVTCSGPTETQPATWGSIKAMYE